MKQQVTIYVRRFDFTQEEEDAVPFQAARIQLNVVQVPVPLKKYSNHESILHCDCVKLPNTQASEIIKS